MGLRMIHAPLQGQCMSFPHHEDTQIHPRWAASLNMMALHRTEKGRMGEIRVIRQLDHSLAQRVSAEHLR